MASRFPFVLIGFRSLPGKASAISVIALFFVLTLAATGCIREDDITLEQRSHQLAAQLMCPVCDGQTIDGSNAQIAQDMRMKVRERLDAGDTNAEIREYFVLRYGEDILAAPSGNGFNLLAWIVPAIIFFGGLGIVFLTVTNMRKSSKQARPASTQKQDDLSDFLAQVDRDLGSSSGLVNESAEPDKKLQNSGSEANS
jgi:cytochrome c-type biogenesis protein CcmH